MDTIQSLVERGLAKPCSFEDIDNYDHKGVPPDKHSWYSVGWSTIDVYCPLSLFQEHIEDVFSRIEGLRYKWDNARCVWHIEYGTKPIEYGMPGLEYRQIMTGKAVAIQAALMAYEKFPDNMQFDDILQDEYEPIYAYGLGSWCIMELRIYNDIKKGCLFIHLNRQTGDRNSYSYLWRDIYHYFNENKLFLSRSSYLGFVEGTEINKECHIQKYLFDDNLVKEFCTYMVHV
jgi:hypothetical protein